MAVVTVPEQISRPGAGAELQPYGLFTVAGGPFDLPVHAIEGGLQFQTPFCGLPDGYAVACAPATKSASLTGAYDTVTGNPFVVLAGSECGAITTDARSPDEYTRDLVLSNLFAGEQRRVENIFSRGLFGQAPGLSTSGATALAASVNVTNAFGLLEEALGAVYGLPGVIHVPLVASAMVMNQHLVERDSRGVWRTVIGTAVSFGNYAGYSPTDVAPIADHTNFYITGAVNVWRSPVPFVSPWAESIDKTTNQVHRFAEREYVVTYECSAFATDVTYKVCC